MNLPETITQEHAKEMLETFIIIADRDKYDYAKEMVEKVTGRKWTSTQLSEAAAVIRTKYGITY